MAKIFILEDSDDSFEIVKNILTQEHQLERAISVTQAKHIFNNNYDLLILDVGLPDGDGFEFCNWTRCELQSGVPIIFVSSRTSTESCITGFTSGGDDYIFKPFHPSEFIARVNSKLRSHFRKLKNNLILEESGIKIDLVSQKTFLEVNGQYTEISLTPIEFKILQMFLNAPGKAINRDEILDFVWGKEVFVYSRSVDTHVSKLRKKLAEKGDLITSVHGRGYRLMTSSSTVDSKYQFELMPIKLHS